MGLFDFVKAAGKKLGIGDDDDEAAEALKKEIDSHDLGSDDITVEVDGDKAIIKGEVASQEALEKIIIAAGNVEGISKIETAVKAPAAKDPVFHTVAKGDSLWKIAAEHYGNGSKYPAIFEANKPMLTHPDKIYPGQVLRIPEA
ncbi:MAG: peptidoglycan-binding protein LysM [Hyphomicrobiales bacterium]|nr:peptidoglycan-binding protein LysM [Hyphomicrobiales bacterium]